MPELFTILSTGLVFVTALSLMIFDNWRLWLGALALQYTCVFVFVAVSWPIEMALVKLVAGWMSVSVFGMALGDYFKESELNDLLDFPGKLFRTMVAILVGLVVVSLVPSIQSWFLDATIWQALGGGFLLGIGIIHLGLTTSISRVIMGLLTVIAGFEVLYATVEVSLLLTSLLAVVNLGIAFVGAFLLSLSILETAK